MRLWIAALVFASACAHRGAASFAPLPAPLAPAPITSDPCVTERDTAHPDVPRSFEAPGPFETAPSFPAPPPPAVAEPPQVETPAAFPTPPSPCDAPN